MSDETPAGLGASGAALWVSLLAQDPDMADPTRELAVRACRVRDLLDRFDVACESAPLTIESDKGAVTTNPLFVERRQQEQQLKQLIAALRLPDEATGKRPQRRVGNATGVRRSSGSARDRLKSVG